MLMFNLSFTTKLIHLHHRHLHFTQTPRITLTRTRTRWLHRSSSSAAAAADDAPPPPPPPRQEEGPVEILKSPLPVFATDDDPTPLQIATSVLLTGAISVFLFRALRRRARRVKELKFRSTGAKTVKEEAVDRLKAMSLSSPIVETKASPPTSPLQVFLGALAAGAIALILYKFTTTVEDSLNRQTISDNYSVRQITITVRTVINGLCYLATFVFGINALGLFLYAGQLTIDSIMGEPSNKKTSTKDEPSSKIESPTNNTSDNSDESQSSDNP